MNFDAYLLRCFSIGILSTSGPLMQSVQRCVQLVKSFSVGGNDSVFLLDLKGYSLKAPVVRK